MGRRACGEAEEAGGGEYRSAYRGPRGRLRARRSGRPCRCWKRVVPTPGTPSKTGAAMPVKPTLIRHFLPCKQGRSGAFGEPPVDAFEQHRSEEHTSELQSLMRISYAAICLTK